MCGIAGFVNIHQNFLINPEPWHKILEDMTATMVRRGPDEGGTKLQNQAGFGHRRLSIRDISRGTQPMSVTLDGWEYTICYNGEIYNTAELKKDLENKGYYFHTTCDTEIILLGMIEYKDQFINKLNGIYSFAFWDDKEKQLYLVRDRVGIKPLFYTYFENTLVFGSEIKALLPFPGVKPVLALEGMCEIFGLGPAKTPGVGVFENIHDVLPGHFLLYNRDGLKEIKYWDLESRHHEDSYEDTVEKVRCLVKDSVTRQMVSDVPVCCFLSGGVDSSIVTGLSANYLKETNGEPLYTYSFDFAGNETYFQSNAFQPDRDRPWAEKMVKLFGTKHTFLECSNENLADYLYKAVDARDLPCMADVESSLLYFCEQVRENHKVVLTGECADEIFGGYPWFHREDMFRDNAFPWSNNLEARKLILKDDLIHTLPINAYVQRRYQETIDSVPILAGEAPVEKRRRELAYLNIKWFMATLLDRMDRTSMYCGLEGRVPFADHRIMEYVFNVPWDIKYKDGTVKHLLRKSAEGLLPDELLYRKKSPYPKTYNPGYEAILRERMTAVLTDKSQPIHDFIDIGKTKALLAAPSDYGKPWYGQLMAGPQMIAYFLQINYWLERYHVDVRL